MRLHSLESRVVTLFIVLILAVQLAGFFAIRNAIDSNARAAIQEELKISEKIFGHLLDQNKQKLTEGARVLASEFAFREAIATNDTDTIVSALSNLGDRFGASFSTLVRLDKTVAASTNKDRKSVV